MILKFQFKKVGYNFKFDPFSTFSFETISVGNNVFISSNAFFQASESEIIIGNKVMFGPNVTIMGGDHNISEIGEYMFDVKNKLPENDVKVIIEDDVWVASNSIILKGVKVGKGSIIAAGSLVLNDVPEYSIVGGAPAKLLKKRFSKDDLIKHKKKIKCVE